MGEIEITGPAAEDWLDRLVTNRVGGLATGRAVYTAICRDDGGVLDDMLVYRLADQRWLVVCNAANREKIVAWFTKHLPPEGVAITDVSDATALVAVQGPAALPVMKRLPQLRAVLPRLADLAFYAAFTVEVDGDEWLISRTGYTGERGYEIYVPNRAALALWDALLAGGRDLGIAPAGLAARDTLRFEMAYCLYGHELNEETTPLEAGIGWAVKLKKESFVGRDALREQKRAGVPRRLVGLETQGRAIARQGTTVLVDGAEVGRVTSGTFSPTLKRSLALALVSTEMPRGTVEVDVRGRRLAVRELPIPFLSSRVKGDPQGERTLS
jgi:aminomethyltransferase